MLIEEGGGPCEIVKLAFDSFIKFSQKTALLEPLENPVRQEYIFICFFLMRKLKTGKSNDSLRVIWLIFSSFSWKDGRNCLNGVILKFWVSWQLFKKIKFKVFFFFLSTLCVQHGSWTHDARMMRGMLTLTELARYPEFLGNF